MFNYKLALCYFDVADVQKALGKMKMIKLQVLIIDGAVKKNLLYNYSQPSLTVYITGCFRKNTH